MCRTGSAFPASWPSHWLLLDEVRWQSCCVLILCPVSHSPTASPNIQIYILIYRVLFATGTAPWLQKLCKKNGFYHSEVWDLTRGCWGKIKILISLYVEAPEKFCIVFLENECNVLCSVFIFQNRLSQYLWNQYS